MILYPRVQLRKFSLSLFCRASASFCIAVSFAKIFTRSTYFDFTSALSIPTPMASKASSKVASSSINTLYIHWFRHGDLRIHDNPALIHTIKAANTNANTSLSEGSRILPIFFFDPRFVGGDSSNTTFGTTKCGPRRAKFLIESVANLRENLSKLGSGLVVHLGKPEEFFETLTKERANPLAVKITCQEEVAAEEKQVVSSVEEILGNKYGPRSPSASVTQVWGTTLYNLHDLPFGGSVKDMPDTFTPFRTKVEKNCAIEKPLPPPSKNQLHSTITTAELENIICKDNCSLDYLPTLTDLGYSSTDELDDDPRGVMNFKGGESAALGRVQEYIWDKDMLKVYFDTRNGMLGPDYSSKFSPWLAHGCLSPRYVAEQCFKYENQRVANKSTYWLVFELLWRDFFKFLALKHGNSIFFLNGIVGSSNSRPWRYDRRYLEAWKEGKTGYPLVDANMRELKATGFMSNRGRQNVCSFLALDMNFDWRYGAYFFEQELLDYDVYSNWGNWASGAGVMGGRLNRFNIVKQSKDYDFDGDYVRHWLPELKKVPSSLIHEPWKMSVQEQDMYGVKLGVDYPSPIVRPSSFSRNNDAFNGHGSRKNPTKNTPKGDERKIGGKKEMKSLPKGNYRFH